MTLGALEPASLWLDSTREDSRLREDWSLPVTSDTAKVAARAIEDMDETLLEDSEKEER
jgi:hypothetical protein